MSLCMIENNAQTWFDGVSLLCNTGALFNRADPIFIDYLGFRVYLGINRTRHASGKLVFQCASGGSFFARNTFISKACHKAGLS